VSEVDEAGEGQFVDHLPDVQEIFGPRAEFRRDIELLDVRARHKPEGRSEVFLDLLPVQAEIPQIVRVPHAKAECTVLPRQPLIPRLEQKSVDAEVLIFPEKAGAEEPEVSAKGPTEGGAGRIAVREDAADVGLLQDVALDAGDEEVLLFSQVGGARPRREQADVCSESQRMGAQVPPACNLANRRSIRCLN